MIKVDCILDSEQVQAQKEYIINVFGIKLFDSEERDDRLSIQFNNKHTTGYRYLAMIYWPEIFENTDKTIHVHHINGDRSDNRVCNLVPVTISQHHKLHAVFFPKCQESLKIFQAAGTSTSAQRNDKHMPPGFGEEVRKRLTGRKLPEETREKMRQKRLEYWRKKKEGLI